jgi:tRNA/rRNA methyltransferase
MAGTDHRQQEFDAASPVIILVEPQLAENIGMAARAMANFGLSRLRLVKPRDGWPTGGGLKKGATQAASGASFILEEAELFDSVEAAIADLNVVYATTARERGQMKQVFAPAELMPSLHPRLMAGERIGILFGRERTGLSNDEVSLADAIITFPVNPGFASLNLAQAVLLVGYDWFRSRPQTQLPFEGRQISPPATRESVVSFFDFLEEELEAVAFFPPDKRPVMARNLRDILHRLAMTEQEVRTLRGAISALVKGRRGGRNLPRPSRLTDAARRGLMPLPASPSTDPTGERDDDPDRHA